MKRRCDECAWWGKIDIWGCCRIKSPTLSDRIELKVTANGEETMKTSVGIWPATRADDWCGEFKPREDKDGD